MFQTDALLVFRQTAYGEDFKVKEATTYKENNDDVDHIQISADQVSHDYQSDIDVPNNKTTITLNDDLWKQVTQMNDANLLGSLTYTTKAQQPFKIVYDYTKSETTYTYDADGNLLQDENYKRKVSQVRKWKIS